MNTQSLIPLVAAVAYIPLLIILAFNRPWQRAHTLFVLFLIPAILWSVSDVFFRSAFFMEYKFLLLKIGLCLIMCAAIQYHYFLASFYQPKGFGVPFAHILLAAIIVVTALGYFAEDVSFREGVAIPHYGIIFIPVASSLSFLIGRDFFFLLRRFTALADPVRRNQILYLFAGFILMGILGFSALAPVGRHYPLAHLGSVFNAGILTYVVVRHRLLDVRLVFRRVLGWLSLGALGTAVFVLLLFLVNLLLGSKLELGSLAETVLAVVVAGVFVYWLRGLFIAGIDRFFYKERYDYRRKLRGFVRHRLSGFFTLEEMGSELLSLLIGSLDCRRAFLLLPEAASGDFVVDFAAPEKQDVPQVRIKKDSPISEWLRRENSYLSKEKLDIIAEFRGLWAEERKELEAISVELLFPLISRNNLVAILALGRRTSGQYLLDDMNLVENITSQVAVSLEKEYLQEQLRKREQELFLLNRLAAVITSSLNIQKVYDAFIAELKEVVDIDWATIALIHEDTLSFEALSTAVESTWQTGEKIPLEGTGAEWVANHKKLLVERDLTRVSRFWTSKKCLEMGIRSVVSLPLVVKDNVIGCLIIASRQPNAYSSSQVDLLKRLASQIAVPVENSRLYAQAEQRARVDELTGLFNRRHFDERLKQEVERHSRYIGMLSLAFLDLDFFKAYNDKRGHMAGDKVLIQIGNVIQKSIRNTDVAFRYGGDEFAVISPQSEADDALIMAERVRGNIEREMAKRKIRITASIGLASWPSDGVMADELVTAADRALYYAKQTGGNRTCVVSRMLPSLTATTGTATTTEKEALSTIYALAATIEARDQYTYGHSKKVGSYAVALAESIGLAPEKVAVISTAALLHDIGKIGITDEVLNKVGKLKADEWELIRGHPKLSATIVGHVFSLVSCLPAILHHHERWDGTGYPSGLKGEAIPIEARILAIADAFDAMTSLRPYRSAMSYKEAVGELKRGSGTQFDSELVEAFLPIALSTAPEEIGVGGDYSSSKVESTKLSC